MDPITSNEAIKAASQTSTYFLQASLATPGSTRNTTLPVRLEGDSIALDGEGNIYTAGHAFEVTGSAALIKYNPNGEVQWIKEQGPLYNSTSGTGHSLTLQYGGGPHRVTVDPSGNPIVIGTFRLGAANASASSSHYGDNLCVSKYDPDGNLSWSKLIVTTLIGSSRPEFFAADITTDDSGNIYGSVQINSYSTSNPGSTWNSSEAMVFKLNSSGGWNWKIKYGGLGSNAAGRIHVIDEGSSWGPNVYLCTSAQFPIDSSGNTRMFGHIIRIRSDNGSASYPFLSDGQAHQHPEIRNSTSSCYNTPYYGDELCMDIQFDSNGLPLALIFQNNTATQGAMSCFASGITGNAGRLILVKFSNTSFTGISWSKMFFCSQVGYSGPYNSGSYRDFGNILMSMTSAKLCVDSNDNIYVAGTSGIDTNAITRGIITKLDSSGNEVWVRDINTDSSVSKANYGWRGVTIADMKIDSKDNIHIVGQNAANVPTANAVRRYIAKLPSNGNFTGSYDSGCWDIKIPLKPGDTGYSMWDEVGRTTNANADIYNLGYSASRVYDNFTDAVIIDNNNSTYSGQNVPHRNSISSEWTNYYYLI
jgi:hypothetical protein